MKKCNSKFEIQGIGFLITITGLLKILWNKLFPELFGTKKITYWQSVMLYLICKALFDFRYNIKDSFNFGNNTINGEESSNKKNTKTTQAKEEPIVEKEVEVEVEVKDDKVKEAKEAVKDATQKTVDTAEKKVNDAKDAVKNATKKTMDTAEKKVEDVKDKAKDFSKKVKDATKEDIEIKDKKN